jgi:hypothetical protein
MPISRPSFSGAAAARHASPPSAMPTILLRASPRFNARPADTGRVTPPAFAAGRGCRRGFTPLPPLRCFGVWVFGCFGVSVFRCFAAPPSPVPPSPARGRRAMLLTEFTRPPQPPSRRRCTGFYRLLPSMKRTKSSGTCRGCAERMHIPVAVGVGRSAHLSRRRTAGVPAHIPRARGGGSGARRRVTRDRVPPRHVARDRLSAGVTSSRDRLPPQAFFERGPTERNAQPSIRDPPSQRKVRNDGPMKNKSGRTPPFTLSGVADGGTPR